MHSFIENGFWNHDVEDNAYALMRTYDGIAFLHSSATQWEHRFNLDITLTEGAICYLEFCQARRASCKRCPSPIARVMKVSRR